MSPARPAHTETESSMMFMAAKPDDGDAAKELGLALRLGALLR